MRAAQRILDGLGEAVAHAVSIAEQREAMEADMRFRCLELALRIPTGREVQTAREFYAFVSGADLDNEKCEA